MTLNWSLALAGHPERRDEARRILGLAGLFFLALCVLGMLRPIRNAFALDGLVDVQFYRVYFVSALVVLFVPLYRHVARGIPWRTLIPALAFFFALTLVLFRLAYRQGSAAYGLVFYGWYDLFSAALVTQFFVATQTLFDARSAKSAYPRVIAGGAIGASLGGALTGFLAGPLGTPNLLLVAAALLAAFGLGLPLLWGREVARGGRSTGRPADLTHASQASELRRLAAHPHVRQIALMVLLTAVVKQFVDYEFNVVIGRAMGTRDAVSAFQGKFYGVTQWMPLLVLAALPAVLRRWGVGLVVLLLPGVLLIATAGIAFFWTLWAAVVAKGAEQVLGHSSERTSREILYVPLPDDVKLAAKTWVDLAVDGIGKGLSGLAILGLLVVMGPRGLAAVAALLCLGWLAAAVGVRREYVRSLASSIRGRFASVQGPLATLGDASSTPVVREALEGESPLQAAFILDLLDRSSADDVARFADEIHALLSHDSERIRERALQVLRHAPVAARPERVRTRLSDPDENVRRAAVQVLLNASGSAESVLGELLGHDDPRVRTATLSSVADEGIPWAAPVIRDAYFRGAARITDGVPASAERRLELAVAAASLDEGAGAERLLARLIRDPDPQVASAALRSAGTLGLVELDEELLWALGGAGTRKAGADALTRMEADGLQVLTRGLEDEELPLVVRRHVPAVLGRLDRQEAADTLLRGYAAPETDQLLDYRTLKALNKLHLRRPDLTLDRAVLQRTLDREVAAARRYGRTGAALGPPPREEEAFPAARGATRTLARALADAGEQRRESAFRVLSLMFPDGDAMYHCYLALSSRDRRVRGNALEWLEQTVGPDLFRRLRPVAEPAGGRPERVDRATGGWRAARRLWADKDRWIARCAVWAVGELRGEAALEELETFGFRDPGVARSAARLRRLVAGRAAGRGGGLGGSMDLIQKVFLLQNVDLLREARSSQLALLASIAEEEDVEENTVLVERGEPTTSLYVVIRGGVDLEGLEEQRLHLSEGGAFGTWALIDQSASLVEARTTEPTRLLRIDRRGFEDLLSDHPELGLDLLRGLARRFRALAGR